MYQACVYPTVRNAVSTTRCELSGNGKEDAMNIKHIALAAALIALPATTTFASTLR